MPLSAIVGGIKRIGQDIPPEEWKKLQAMHRRKELPIAMIWCNQPGHMVKRKGLQFFRHAPGFQSCNCIPESEEHLRLKYQIYELCKSLGWQADTEVTSSDGSWRADVLATKGERKIAIEVQLSPILFDTLMERDKKYRTSGIESYWLKKYRDDYQQPDITFGHTSLSSGVGIVNKWEFFKETESFKHYVSNGLRTVELTPELNLENTISDFLTGNFKNSLEEGKKEFHDVQNRRKRIIPLLSDFERIKGRVNGYKDRLKTLYPIYKSAKKSTELIDAKNNSYATFKELDTSVRITFSPQYGWEYNERAYFPVLNLHSTLQYIGLKSRIDEILQKEKSFLLFFKGYEALIKESQDAFEANKEKNITNQGVKPKYETEIISQPDPPSQKRLDFFGND